MYRLQSKEQDGPRDGHSIKRNNVSFGVIQTIVLDNADEERKGPWEEMARDRKRFQDRIKQIEQQIGYVFQIKHRDEIYRKRGLEKG